MTYFSIMDPTRLKAGDVYWDDVRTPEVEDRFDIIGRAFNTAGDALVGQLGADETQWAWGRKHGFLLEALLADLSSFFNVYNNPPGEDGDAVEMVHLRCKKCGYERRDRVLPWRKET